MKQGSSDKLSAKRNGYQSDDDNVRYKINTKLLNNPAKSNVKPNKKPEPVKIEDDDDIRYKFPTAVTKTKSPEKKPKPKSKIKVNFWSNKQNVKRLHNNHNQVIVKEKTNRRHTVGTVPDVSPSSKSKPAVKVRKRVSFLPSPLFSDNHVPMVTVPDDLTIQLNEEEANDLGEDLNHAFVNSDSGIDDTKSNPPPRKKARTSTTQTSPRSLKGKRGNDELDSRPHANDNELEFFSKYVVQKLRRMETNQRIYSENLINTVLMLGQLGKLSGKSKIGDA
ncbi:uncharacterized protein [Epargyreus clarus]|uniref:uncharacterized protein n=1 Tax=Epargyreus clarus TaxID=520877 RepID=UPI003C2D7995